jgi:hypothetical protein
MPTTRALASAMANGYAHHLVFLLSYQLAKELGYLQIGREVPSTYSLTDIVKSMPEE